ncbi:MAG TPA: hypothetical protein VEA41_17470 [Salinarimonas sp.]|nr:hypothetical protein [Salinarimonas sp.]
MATEYGTRGPGERGRSIIPNHAAAGDLAEGCAPEFVGPAESSQRDSHLSRGITRKDLDGSARDWGYTKAFLTGLGLWQLPGGGP